MLSRLMHGDDLVRSVRVDPQTGVKYVKEWLRRAKGNMRAASRISGVSRQCLWRYVKRFALEGFVEEVRTSTGWWTPEARGGVPLYKYKRRLAKAKAEQKRAASGIKKSVDGPVGQG